MFDLNEDGHWSRRNIYENVVRTTHGLRFEPSVQMENVKSAHFVQKVHPHRGCIKTSTVHCVRTTVSEATIIAVEVYLEYIGHTNYMDMV